MLNWSRGSTVILTAKYNIVKALHYRYWESRGNVNTNLLLHRISDVKYWKRGGNVANSSTDKWISTIKSLINKKSNPRHILQGV